MPVGQQSAPEYFNPWIGTAYGNILDQYSSSVYNAKLYIINPLTAPPSESAQSSETSRQNVGAPGAGGQTLTDDPDRTVVIAQTGVTAGNTIDNISISTMGGAVTGVSFEITQPNRADLLDQIVLARSFLNCEGTQGVYFYLEIFFKGYTDEADFFVPSDSDDGGQLVDIVGPYRWKIIPVEIGCNVTDQGATFSFDCKYMETVAFENRRFRLGQNITAKGKTITEMVKSVEDGINKFFQENNDKQIKDEVIFDLSGLLKSASTTPDQNKILIEDENLILPNVDTGDIAKAPLNRSEAEESGNAGDRVEDAQTTTGDQDEINAEETTNIITFKPGESIEEIMNKILAMCPEARFRHSRKTNPDDIDDQECRKDQAFIQKLKINAGVEDIGYDKRTNTAAYKVIYRPVLYREASDTQFVIPEENEDLSPEEVQARFEQIIGSGNLRKAYQYLFTGVNDQIVDLDITYNTKSGILMTPRRGLVGTADAAAAKEKTDNVDKDEDTSIAGLFDSLTKGFEALAKDTISNLFNGELAGIQGGLENLVSTLNDQGFSNSQLAQLTQAIQSGAQSELNQFLETVDSATLRNLATNLVINPLNPTTVTPPDYSPEQSGYQYSEDFFALNQTTGIDVGDLNSFGFIADVERPDSQSQMETTQKDTDVPTTNPVEEVTVDFNKPQSNTIFGQLINQAAAANFLVELNMTVRGDPWYIGYDTSQGQGNNTQASQNSSDSYESSQPNYAYFGADTNYFFLEIASPRPWDFDYRDEDSLLNSGYWMNTNTSHTFTGLYFIKGVTHNFSGGVYTTDIRGVKIPSINSLKIPKQQPGAD